MGGNRANIDPRVRALLMTIRQALLIVLGGIEEYLGIERSVKPKRKRHKP